MCKKVNILLSTYNGEKYICEQMDSLLAQDYRNLAIHVRDDGSADNTWAILEDYKNKFPEKIFLYKGDNVGYRRSFQWLMYHCDDADLFSFCDQDDYWYPEKISRAVERLTEVAGDWKRPFVYLCNFFWCDANLQRDHRNDTYLKSHSLEKFITLGDRNAFGFTQVFNKAALEGARRSRAFASCGHDDIVYLYCICKGDVIRDDRVCADYRRHGNNSSKYELVGGNVVTHFFWRVKTFILKSDRDALYKNMKIFYQDFKDELGAHERQVFRLYLGKKGRIRKLLYKGRYRDTWFDEISIRILFLLGKV
jgi:glycosyltransferase involved in cell wall biosynthesis